MRIRFFKGNKKKSSRRNSSTSSYESTSNELAPEKFQKEIQRLRPSTLGTLFHVFNELIKPAFAIALIAGFYMTVSAEPLMTLSERIQKALAEFDMEVADESESLDFAYDLDELTAIQADNGPRENVAAEIARRKKLVGYITGLITHYRPKLRNSGEVARKIVEASAVGEIDPLYIAAIVSVESRFLTHARSHVGALGLMQIMPATGKELNRTVNGKNGLPPLTHPDTNLKLGIEYIKKLEGHYRGNRFDALAAYNWGLGNVNKVGRNKTRYPRGVRKYSSTILERTLLWNKHFKAVERSAEKITAESIALKN